jgi:toxin HigB-1
MIQTFADQRTERLIVTGTATRVPTDIAVRTACKLEYVHLATTVDDLTVPPGNGLHALRGDRKGQHAIAVNE